MEIEEDDLTDEECDTTWKIKTRTVWAFGVIGFLADFFFAIFVSASQDILEATTIPTSVVLLSTVGPACLVSVVYPYFVQRVSVSVACCVIFIVSVPGMLITSLVGDPGIKIIGVCLVSFGIGGTETVFFSLTSFYGTSTVNSYALGSGISFLAAPLSYIALTMLLCLSPQVSLLLTTALWILLPISYMAIEKPNNRSHPTSYKEIPYSPVESSDASNFNSESSLSTFEMLLLVWQTQPFCIGLFVSIYSKQLLLSSVMTTLASSNVSVTPRNQYLLYVFVSGVGELLGRPYLGFLSRCGIQDKFTVRKPWFLALLNVFILILIVFLSWFRFWFLSHFYAVAALVFVNTFLAGIVYVNTFLFVGEGLGVAERRFCRALLTGALWTANLAVALIGFTVESQLREHCVYSFDEAACFTRSLTAWDPSVSCVF